ncbi:hypothetical protein [Algiphilus sp.]|uniref:hypothetical protein n=1 Tax=Algiphilus sp. TaxID=1872431 RepID=UPI003B5241C0
MAVLESFSQFYAWSWIATIAVLLLPLLVLFLRDARTPKPPLNAAVDMRFRRSLLARMLDSLGIDRRVYVQGTGEPALAKQLDQCDGCARRAACMQDLAYGQPQLETCVNVDAITRYLGSRK